MRLLTLHSLTYTLLAALILAACTSKQIEKQTDAPETVVTVLTMEQAKRLIQLPLRCLNQAYPNKLGQVLADSLDLKSPQQLHPTFYGCFDWHSAVHGHWLLVRLVKKYPELDSAETISRLLTKQFESEKIKQEIAFFESAFQNSFERTYGWAWLLKLQEELMTWDHPQAKVWAANLQPLADLIATRYIAFLPKLQYPIRSGEHTNTAFGLSFALDYARSVKDTTLETAISLSANRFYAQDHNYPLDFEPSGYDFLSPGLQEIDLMNKVLDPSAFDAWLKHFCPQILEENWQWEVGRVGDRSDGKLVHLDGLNFSRAWCLFTLAKQKKYAHLKKVAETHLQASLSAITDGDYMGEHWLASFALYALLAKE